MQGFTDSLHEHRASSLQESTTPHMVHHRMLCTRATYNVNMEVGPHKTARPMRAAVVACVHTSAAPLEISEGDVA